MQRASERASGVWLLRGKDGVVQLRSSRLHADIYTSNRHGGGGGGGPAGRARRPHDRRVPPPPPPPARRRFHGFQSSSSTPLSHRAPYKHSTQLLQFDYILDSRVQPFRVFSRPVRGRRPVYR